MCASYSKHCIMIDLKVRYSILHSKTVCSFPAAVLIEAFHLLVNFSNCWLTKVTSVREMRKVYELRKEEDFRKRFSINLWWSCQERFSLDKSIKAKQHTVEKRRHSAAAGWWHLTNLFFFVTFQNHESEHDIIPEI